MLDSIEPNMYGHAVNSGASPLPVPVLLKLDTRENGFDFLFVHALVPLACQW